MENRDTMIYVTLYGITPDDSSWLRLAIVD